ncbi:hypothetical protein [Actinokineospora iranica]|uniref:Zinc-finger n=1 Tax=Actinokineospora iranica TaxID=1271860 RepID=A0A1G6JGN6_9PSEU|nr:hypothetical protein [Actinokineospora iranica]SDC17851.1 hypothetical protein SAMN05216174_101396 [Actinokineospora iranica]
MNPTEDPRGEVCWGISDAYGGRTHLVLLNYRVALCAMPVDTRYRDRPSERMICPECAIAYIAAVFPARAIAPTHHHDIRLRA